MSSIFYKGLSRTLSRDRLRRYSQEGRSLEEQIAYYRWNMALSESLYPSLQGLEVALRNAIHDAATQRYGTDRWFDSSVSSLTLRGFQSQQRGSKWIHHNEAYKIEKIKRYLGGRYSESGKVVSELTFGFWVSLFNRYYTNQGMWPTMLAHVFPNMKSGRTMTIIRPLLEEARDLRNRTFHHESIFDRSALRKNHSDIMSAIGWICPETKAFVDSVDRFEEVYESGPMGHGTPISEIISRREQERDR